jgi:hypothetical protein
VSVSELLTVIVSAHDGRKLYGRPEGGLGAKHILSGFVVCGECLGGRHAIRRTSQRGRPRVYYMCINHRVNHACTHALTVHVSALDDAVLTVLRRDVLTSDIVEATVERAVALARLEPDAHVERHNRLSSEAAR